MSVHTEIKKVTRREDFYADVIRLLYGLYR